MGGNLRPKLVGLILLILIAGGLYFFLAQSEKASIPVNPAYWPTEGWQSSTPEEQGLDSAKLAQGLRAIHTEGIDIHSLLVIRDGNVIIDTYFYPYDGTTAHDLASVTKSFTTTLIGIAVDQGKLKLDQPVISFFPERTIKNLDPRKEHLTVRHLASMTNGLESIGFANDEGTLTAMRASQDWIQFALDRPMITEPGTQFVYDSPGMHLLSAVLQKATGQTELEFARQSLFKPLNIQEVIWPADPQGYTHGWGDLHLKPRDAAKIGYLWLNKGVWDGKQIISPQWIENSIKAQANETGTNDDYGLGWWVMNESTGEYAAIGRGGQRVHVFDPVKLIVVTTGSGFEIDELWPYLEPALVDPENPLPPNPAGVEELKAAVAEVVKAPAARPVALMPEMARTITGKTYQVDANPLQLKSLRLDFNGSDQALLNLVFTDERSSITQPVGLDGTYRFMPGDFGLPEGMRGYWADDKTFVLEQDRIANFDHYIFRLVFDGDQVTVTGSKADHELGITFTGRA